MILLGGCVFTAQRGGGGLARFERPRALASLGGTLRKRPLLIDGDKR
jgi:hypothetical protein